MNYHCCHSNTITYSLAFEKMWRAILSEFPDSCNAVDLISKSQDTNNTRLSRYLTTLKTEDRYMGGAVAASAMYLRFY
jgi:hypothetical protein